MSRMRETMATANVHKAGQLRNQMKILARVTSGRELILIPALTIVLHDGALGFGLWRRGNHLAVLEYLLLPSPV